MLTSWRKSQARKSARRLRASLNVDPKAAERSLIANFPDEIWPKLHSVVAGYRAIGSEIDPEPLMETFFCEQASLALPVVLGVGKPLIFRNWSPGDELVKGPYKIDEPSSDARETVPELVLVPLLGFDEVGRRLGYGGGYYDRTLARLKQSGSVKLVGLAYEAQKLSRVPADTYDVSLDYVVTDQTCYRCN